MSALRERLIEAIREALRHARVDNRTTDELRDLLWRLEKGDPV